jgi:hypothetical protein
MQFGGVRPIAFEIVGGDVVGFANDIDRDGIYENDQNLRGQ